MSCSTVASAFLGTGLKVFCNDDMRVIKGLLNLLGWGHVRNSTNYAINVGSRSSFRNLRLKTNLV